MKKIVTVVFALSIVVYFSCKKEEAGMPTACFTVSGLDSAKVAAFDSTKIDSIIRVQAPGYFVSVEPGTPVNVYKRTLIFRNCGTSNYSAIYTGDSSHIYVDPSNPGNVTTAQTGTNFSGSYFMYKYKSPGTYTITVVGSNVSSTGKDLKRNYATKTVTLQ